MNPPGREAVFTAHAKELAEIIGRASGNPDEGWGIWRDWLKSFASRLEAYDATYNQWGDTDAR